MMNENFEQYVARYKQLIDETSVKEIEQLNIPDNLKASMIYSLQAGGKRIRPLLLFASYQAYEEDIDKVLLTAVAIELIHTYSLIHDDLPAMDDDDLRRGKPTNHRVYDEATAILAGDALLTYSFEWIATDTLLTSDEKTTLISWLAAASGPMGMVAGQMLDLQAEETKISLTELENIHRLKTGQLISFSIKAGAYLGRANSEQLRHLEEFAKYTGLIFQIQDDILDIIGDEDSLGKPVGS